MHMLKIIKHNIFTILAIIKPIRHISKMPPNLLKSIFVKYPINDIIANIPAVIKVIQFIYDNIMYAELNTKSEYCQVCGFDGEIKIVEDDGKLVWECPKCGNRDQTKLNVARRTCGYIGSQFWNQGRTQEIRDRVMHL